MYVYKQALSIPWVGLVCVCIYLELDLCVCVCFCWDVALWVFLVLCLILYNMCVINTRLNTWISTVYAYCRIGMQTSFKPRSHACKRVNKPPNSAAKLRTCRTSAGERSTISWCSRLEDSVPRDILRSETVSLMRPHSSLTSGIRAPWFIGEEFHGRVRRSQAMMRLYRYSERPLIIRRTRLS